MQNPIDHYDAELDAIHRLAIFWRHMGKRCRHCGEMLDYIAAEDKLIVCPCAMRNLQEGIANMTVEKRTECFGVDWTADDILRTIHIEVKEAVSDPV